MMSLALFGPDPPRNSALLHQVSCVARPTTIMAMSFEAATQIILEQASRLNQNSADEHDTTAWSISVNRLSTYVLATALFAGTAQAAPLPSTSTSTTYHRVQVDGVGIFYREAGPENAPTIVLLHGFPVVVARV